jgi:dipeptidyl aminopeptidase/acylaminoacyl peptidase
LVAENSVSASTSWRNQFRQLDEKARFGDDARMRISSVTTFVLSVCLAPSLFAQAPAKRPIALDDIYRMQQVGNPQVSPDGKWVAYTVTSIDREADKRRTAIWMVNWDGTQDVRLTYGNAPVSSPRWSPDGRYLAFLSARDEDAKTQVWLLDRRGGDAHPLTEVKDELSGYAWSPDGKKLVLEMSPGEGEESTADGTAKSLAKAPKPIVIDRTHFKEDREGYLTAASRTQLYLFDLDSKKIEPLTTDKNFEDSDPVWSPDGMRIAFVSDHSKDPDLSGTNDIFVVDARAGATPRKIVSAYEPGGQHLAWSPDGKLIAYLVGLEPKYNAYGQSRLFITPVDGGAPRALTDSLDRGVSSPEFTADSSSITFLFEDDRHGYVARVPAAGGAVEKLSGSEFVALQRSSISGHFAVAAANDTTAAEIFALESGKFRKLTSHNDALLSELQLGVPQDISFKSKDGTEVHGMMIKPPSFETGGTYPTLLWIHGGPNMQDDHALQFDTYPLQLERQLFAARGYLVLAINYRGSDGRGSEYTRSIFADWGNKEVADLLAGMDYAVASGIADPNRLGVGGWSYGGILTDYLIASDGRFKAAISGAGSANQISMYGSDQYVLQYNNEIGPPWKSLDTWIKVSYPFFHADRIHTPTLFMGGQSDFNVPIIGGEQMYQALRTLDVPTELVIYPGQFHLFTRPSYIYDRMERYFDWFDKYLKRKN